MAPPRWLEPEWLDELPVADPRAQRSRRDLRRINGWMGQVRIMAGLLSAHAPAPPRTMLELGCGDGAFTLAVARRLAPRWPAVHVVMLDRQDVVADHAKRGLDALGWSVEVRTADVFDLLAGPGLPRAEIVTANLFLHHFEREGLAALLGGIAARTSLLVACEPRRSRLALLASRCIGLIGGNDVSRHDAVVSVRGGFAEAGPL